MIFSWEGSMLSQNALNMPSTALAGNEINHFESRLVFEDRRKHDASPNQELHYEKTGVQC
jgi:hypothetical protein